MPGYGLHITSLALKSVLEVCCSLKGAVLAVMIQVLILVDVTLNFTAFKWNSFIRCTVCKILLLKPV